ARAPVTRAAGSARGTGSRRQSADHAGRWAEHAAGRGKAGRSRVFRRAVQASGSRAGPAGGRDHGLGGSALDAAAGPPDSARVGWIGPGPVRDRGVMTGARTGTVRAGQIAWGRVADC